MYRWTVAKAALARSSTGRTSSPGPNVSAGVALGVAGAPGDLAARSGGGPVARRVGALLNVPPGRRLILLTGVVLVLLATGLCTLEALRDLETLLESASV